MLVLVSLLLSAPGPTFAGPIGPLDLTKPEQAPPKLAAAMAALQQKDTGKARALAREFLKEQPNSAYGHEVLGITELVSGQWKDAETALLASLKLDPNRQSARLLLGQLYLQTNEPAKRRMVFLDLSVTRKMKSDEFRSPLEMRNSFGGWLTNVSPSGSGRKKQIPRAKTALGMTEWVRFVAS